MSRNRYRTKLLLAFWSLAIVMSAVIGIFMVRQSREALMEQIRSQVLSIAVVAASEVDGDLHEEIQKPGDESGKAYRTIEGQLRQIRDLNRRDDVHVEYVYTMRLVSKKPDVWVYVADADETEEEGGEKAPIGKVVTWEEQGEPEDEPLILGEAYGDQRFSTDEYGSWLTAYAPIRNSTGEIVAMVGVDLFADDVRAKRDALLYTGLAGFAITILLGALLAYLLAKWTTRPLDEVVEAIDRISRGHLGARISVNGSDEFAVVSKAFNQMAESFQERDALKGALSRYVSHDIGKRLIAEKKLPVFEGERQDMTILYCDSPNISRLAKKRSPKETVEILNDYLERLVHIIFRHHGTLDRRCGNGLIAVFGAPLSDDSKERNAIRAAIEMQKEQDRLNEKWELEGDDQFRFGIGIHTGEAVLGNIGADNCVEFTVVGESLDIAIMIEGRRKGFNSSTVVSEAVVDRVRDEFPFREVGDIDRPDWSHILRLYTLPAFRIPA